MLSAAVLVLLLSPATVHSGAFKTLSFDEATNKSLVRSLPLKIAVPSEYHHFENVPQFGTHMWTTQASFEHFQKNGFASPDEGVIQIRVTPNVAFDRSTGNFMCGPDCTEADVEDQIRKAGGSEIATEKQVVARVPIWLIEAKMPPAAGHGPSKVYIAYVAALVDSNVLLVSFTPSTKDPIRGELIWRTLKRSLLQTKYSSPEESVRSSC